MEERPRKILVLGTPVRLQGVTSYAWDALPEALNAADFDTVILDFSELPSRGPEEDALALRLDRLPEAGDFSRLIFSEGGRVVAIGNPTRRLPGESPTPFGPRRVYADVTWWLPVQLHSREAIGDVMHVETDWWQFWFDALPEYSWHFTGDPTPLADSVWQLKAAVPWAQGAVAKIAPLATTRTGEALGAQVTVVAMGPVAGSRSSTPELRAEEAPGRIFWLPTPTDVSPWERISMLLSKLEDIEVATPAPEWIDAWRLPAQIDAERAVTSARESVAEAEATLTAAEELARVESRFSRLLYEQGKDALEPIVREALELLGVVVQAPAREGIEDGRLTMPDGTPAMLEIKGKRGQLKVDDVRQLDDWMRTAMAEEEWDGKGIIVANLKLDLPPNERNDVVAPQALKFAERVGIAILTTHELHAAIEEVQRGSFDVKSFWDRVRSAKGLLD